MKAGEKHRTQSRSEKLLAALAAGMTVITCPACGEETDLWTGGEETRCEACDQELYKRQRKDH